MFANSENWEDVKKYYQGCWIKVKECGERIYYVDKVSQKYTDLSSPSRGEGDDEDEIRIDMSIGYSIDYVIPKKTVFQYGEKALLLQRIPARMWRKGMDAKNTEFLTLDEKGTWKKISLSSSIIEGFVNKPSYYGVNDAINNFDKALVSAALTPRISLNRMGSVFIDTIFVGRFNKEKNILTHKTIYANELVPLFPQATIKSV